MLAQQALTLFLFRFLCLFKMNSKNDFGKLCSLRHRSYFEVKPQSNVALN